MSRKSNPLACKVTVGPPSSLKPCTALGELLSEKRGLGVRRAQMADMRTCKPTREQWTLHSGKYAKGGINLAFCPMCGTPLDGLYAHLLVKKPKAAPHDR